MQLDGTARPSMMQELIENHTDKDGRIEGEDDIAACTAVTYGGEPSCAISLMTT